MPETIDSIIERIGGQAAVATLLGVGTEAVRKWRQTRAIPTRHWPAILSATKIRFEDFPGSPAPTQAPSAASTDASTATAPPDGATAALVLADGTVFWGSGFGAHTTQPVPAELCFNTGMTGYQETLTDPSYARQIITFTFPHIGNVGANAEDAEAATIAARGLVVKQDVTEPSSWRATQGLHQWLRGQGVPGIAGIDTRALTLRIRDGGPPNGILAHPADGRFDIAALHRDAAAWSGLDGLDLAAEVSCRQTYQWDEATWAWPAGVLASDVAALSRRGRRLRRQAQHPALAGRRRMPRHSGAGDGNGRGYFAPRA